MSNESSDDANGSGSFHCSTVIFDCLAGRGGTEYFCEVYEVSDDGHIEDFTVFPLLDDGSKGDSILEDGFEHEVQEKYTNWRESECGGKFD